LSSSSRLLALAGQNVLLAYLLSEMLRGLLEVLHLGDGYGVWAKSISPLPSRVPRCAAF
jgi:hypothetical protein